MLLYQPQDVGFVGDYPGPQSNIVPDAWIVHNVGASRLYTGGWDDTVSGLLSVEAHSMRSGWARFPYDYWVDLAGRAGIGRGTGISGATSGDVDGDGISNNRETDAILLLLGDGQDPSPAMVETVGRLILFLGERPKYYGHREASTTGTSCPGDGPMRDIVGPLKSGGPAALLNNDDDGDDDLTPEQDRLLRLIATRTDYLANGVGLGTAVKRTGYLANTFAPNVMALLRKIETEVSDDDAVVEDSVQALADQLSAVLASLPDDTAVAVVDELNRRTQPPE